MRLTPKLMIAAGAAGVVALGAIVGGFAIDSKAFALHALSELAGIIISVLVAVLVVDRLVENDRLRRWDLVAEETMRTFRDALVRGGLEMYLRLDVPRPPNADPFTMAMAGPEHLAQSFAELARHLDALSDADLGETEDWLPEVGEHIALVRNGVMPRLLALGDADLVAAGAGVEGAFQDLRHEAWLAERFGGDRIASAAANLAAAMGRAIQASYA